MRWNYWSIPKLQRLCRWGLGMDKKFHPSLYMMDLITYPCKCYVLIKEAPGFCFKQVYMYQYIWVEFQLLPFKCHTKYSTTYSTKRILYNVEISKCKFWKAMHSEPTCIWTFGALDIVDHIFLKWYPLCSLWIIFPWSLCFKWIWRYAISLNIGSIPNSKSWQNYFPDL